MHTSPVGKVIPGAGREVLALVGHRELAESHAAAVELNLLAREERISYPEQQVLLDTHHRIDVLVLVEAVESYQTFVGHGMQAIPGNAVGAVSVERGEFEPVAFEGSRAGDGRGFLDYIIGGTGRFERIDVGFRDG